MSDLMENKMDQEQLIQSEPKSTKGIPWPKPEFKKLKALKAKCGILYKASAKYVKPFIQKNKKHCLIIGSSVGVMIIIGVIAAFTFSGGNHNNKVSDLRAGSTLNTQYVKSQTPQNPIHDQLNDISAKLANIEQNLSSKHAYVDLGQVRQSIESLQSQVNQLATHSNKIITEEIKESTEQLKGQLTTIKKELQVITNAKVHHKILKASSLPFTVLSIDNIQQSEVVTVNVDHKVVPLDIGDSIAGWTLATASNVNQKAEFKNVNDDYVRVNLNAISQSSKGGS